MHLVIAVHCHQPLGNFDHVIAEAVDRAYLPFLDVLDRHPGVRVDLHYSGCLLEWLDRHRPEVLDRLAGLGDRIEWLGGGMYEPILSLIPPADRAEQLLRHRRFIEERFGQRPAVIWPAERVWEPAVCDALAAIGMAGALVDDRVLLGAGLPEAMLDGYVSTDHFGSPADLFPISERLRFAIPAAPPEEALALLGAIHGTRPDGLAVFGDDGEKFGLWPGSGSAAAAGGWLDRFLDCAEEADWLEITTVESYRSRFPAAAHLPVPAGSYREMSRWSAPPGLWAALDEPGPQAAPQAGGPGVLSFAYRYPEVDVVLRRMWALSEAAAGDDPVSAAARTEVLRSQCNDSAWHGWFGGLYLPHLRAEVRRRLIAADRMLGPGPPVQIVDWDGDGAPEVVVSLPSQSWVLDPAAGGALLFFDDLAAGWPVSDVVARHREPYHDDGPADPGPRRWLLDHLVERDAEVRTFADGSVGDLLPPIRWAIGSAHADGDGVAVVLQSRAGGKRVEAAGRWLEATYRIDGLPAGRFGPEVPISVWEGAGLLRAGGREVRVDGPVAADGSRFELVHAGLGTVVAAELDPPGVLWGFPLRTSSMSEAGLEHVTQGIVLWPHWVTGGAGVYRVRLEITGPTE